MIFAGLLLGLFVQAAAPAAPRVVIGLTDGQQLVVENPLFAGIVRGRSADAVLTYRQEKVHGRMQAASIARIDFGEYRKGEPFLLTVTLRNGQKMQVESERYDYLTVSGRTGIGDVTVRHPDPIVAPLRLNRKDADRKDDLTIQYLEFPAPQ